LAAVLPVAREVAVPAVLVVVRQAVVPGLLAAQGQPALQALPVVPPVRGPAARPALALVHPGRPRELVALLRVALLRVVRRAAAVLAVLRLAATTGG
jgi:hypothetical protein